MRLNFKHHLRVVGTETVAPHGRVLVETPEHEIIDIEGCSPDEVEAKLHDLEAWAS